MISVMAIWLYMLLTCYVTGFACIRAIAGKNRLREWNGVDYLYTGVAAVTVYAQIFSIFAGVGLVANFVLLFICGWCIWICRRELPEQLYAFRQTFTLGKAIVALLLFVLFAYGASRGIIHYDTGLYHAQSIRWIEELGVVPGLGNLHSRLAYNSSAFCLSALYSMAFLGGQSYHCCAGFLAFLLALVCTQAFYRRRPARPLLSDFARVIAVYYLLNVFDEMVSPASDYFMVLLVFYIVIRWLELTEREENSYLPYAVLCIMCVCVLTVKLSGALLLLLTLKPAVMMIRENRIKDILKFLCLGITTVLPFLARNVILSGWLVYPFTAIDLFNFDFKIPKGMADYDAREIQVWGRGLKDVAAYDDPVWQWLPQWIRGLDNTDKLFLVLAASGVLILLFLILYTIVWRRWELLSFLHIVGTLSACFLFWLLSAPLIRYGCVFLWLTPVLIWGWIYLRCSPRVDRYKLCIALLVIVGIYKLGVFGLETGRTASADYLVFQKDYENFETVAYELSGYTFYYPAEGDRTGYEDFPASPQRASEEILRSEYIRDGFRAAGGG